jgi:hypothetical protein
MIRTVLFLAMLMLLMNGCTAYRNDSLQRMQSLPGHYSQFDAKLAWEVTSSDNSTVINGVVQNIRYYEMSDLEVWVYSMDSNGKEVHRGVDFVHRLMENEAGSFTIKIPRVASGTRLQFLYKYLGLNGDGGEGADAVSWSQSFEAKVP